MTLPSIPVAGVAACIIFLSISSLSAQRSELAKGGWDEIPEEELTATAPKIDPNAHSEFTYRSVKVDDREDYYSSHSFHNRVKLYDEAAVKDWDKVDIEYFEGFRVTKIKARVIYPDLTVAELSSRDIVRRKIFKNDSFSGYAKSFSFPGLKPGCIIEYSWKTGIDAWFKGVTLDLLSDYPTWRYDVVIKPYKGLAASVRSYNGGAKWEKVTGGFQTFAENLPAKSDVPYVGPYRDFEPFVLVEYSSEIEALEQEKYWNYRAGRLDDVNDELIKPKSGQVKKLASELFAGVGLNEEKVKIAYDYCTTEILNISEPNTVYTEEEIEELSKNKNPSQTLKNGYGTAFDINSLFASLLASGGFQVSLAEVEDRSVCTYHKGKLGGFNLSDWAVAVLVNNEYQYFDPGSSFLPLGVLNAQNTGAKAILIKGKFYEDVMTPEVGPEFSTVSRIADVRIDEYGDLEGSIAIKFDGYEGVAMKRAFSGQTDDEREEFVLEKHWQSRMPRTEIDDFSVKYADSRENGLIVRFNVKIPGYADLAGERMILNPSVFQQGASTVFPDETREVPIGFPFRPLVMDKVTIKVPSEFHYEASSGTTAEFDGALITRKSLVTISDAAELVYQRLYTLKGTLINTEFYGRVKAEFDALNEADHRPLTFVMNSELLTSSAE
ncbi:DUF3857 domain-containing protein [Pelagicoccus sp. SDUM812002]|uniref:DUF3857 domain-containing protein n=1 Tax=Pelagicoccus sp. SDUM812002 TaxID=3041266 RepID=UPI00280D8D5F|nr:DUF3857 domain-containing protein [Pelagicoccus sp. SDUM812002]MDQ8187067.1 DUF3857 domain-containing protein [Pelagicoccus sp. SDUM812002]